MPVKTIETIENAMHNLIMEYKKEPEAERHGYINGVFDMYNAVKKLQRKGGSDEFDSTA